MRIYLFIIVFFCFFGCSSNDDTSTTSAQTKIAPKAFNSSIIAFTATPTTLFAPIGEDPDTLKEELVYKIIKAPSHGIIDDHCFLNTNSESNRSCRYFSDDKFEGLDTIEYQIIDKDNLSSKSAFIDIFVSKNRFSKVFTQTINENPQEELNIVWVIDKSESMLEKRHELQDSIIALTNHFLSKEKSHLNFKMGVLDSNVYKLNPSKPFFARDLKGNIFDLSSDLARRDFDSFQENFANAIAKESIEKSPGRIIASIDQAYLGESNWFKTTDREVVYIIVSNNSELSYTKGSTPGDSNYIDSLDWYEKLTQTQSHIKKLKFYPIVDYKVTKTKTSSDLYNRYHKLASVSNGELFDISNPLEYSLNQIGKQITTLPENSVVKLNNASRSPSNIKVYLDRKLLSIDQWNLYKDEIHIKRQLKPGSFLQIQYTEQ